MSAAESFAATGQEMFVDGSWGPSRSGETFEATSPATGEVIGTVPLGDREDARRAIDAAGRAADDWAALTAFDRAARMHAVGDAIEAHRDELARTLTLDQGKPLAAEAHGEVEELVDYWRMAAEDAKRLGGELPNSFSPGKRIMLVRRPRVSSVATRASAGTSARIVACQVLGEPPAVRRALRHRQRHGPRGGITRHAAVHRAADRHAHAVGAACAGRGGRSMSVRGRSGSRART
jgi:hypothetical protein